LSTRHISKQNITVRVSEAAFQKLSELAEKEGKTKAEQLEHIIHVKLPKYSCHIAGGHPANHYWDESDMNQEGLTFRYRAEKASKKISYWIGSTAVKKIHAHKTHTKFSKARIVEQAIMTYTPLPDHVRAKAREQYHQMQEMYSTPSEPQQKKKWFRPDSQISSEHLFNRIMKRGENMTPDEFDQMVQETYDALMAPHKAREELEDRRTERVKKILRGEDPDA